MIESLFARGTADIGLVFLRSCELDMLFEVQGGRTLARASMMAVVWRVDNVVYYSKIRIASHCHICEESESIQ